MKQFIAACRESEWKPTKDIVDKIRCRARLLSQSVLVEETIGDMKNRRIPRQTTMFRKPETCYALSLVFGSLEARTQYRTPRYDVPLATKRSKLPRHAFEVKAEQRSMPFDKIVSYNSKTTWYSPGAPRLGVRDADTRLLRELRKADAFKRAGEAWLGSMCVAAHLLCFRDASDSPGVWYLGLAHFDDSAVVCWPGTLKADGLPPCLQFFDPDLDVSELAYKAVIDLDSVEACRLKWRSLAWQRRRAAGLACLPPALRMFVFGNGTLKEIAAREAFWDMPIDCLQKLREWMPGDFGAASDNVPQLVFHMIKRVLKCSDMEAVEILQLRLAANDASAVYAKEFLDLDEALEVLEAPDAQMVHDDQKRLAGQLEGLKQLAKDYTTTVQDVKAKHALAPKRGAGKGMKGKKGAEKVAVEASIAHVDAAKYLPPGASIWQGRKTQTWSAHVKPRPRISEPWREDCGRALHRILKRAWQLHLELNGQDWSSCPWVFSADD